MLAFLGGTILGWAWMRRYRKWEANRKVFLYPENWLEPEIRSNADGPGQTSDDGSSVDWKYIPIRRLALFIEQSLYRGVQWVVFDPNDQPRWERIRRDACAFMNEVRHGAFQGQRARKP